MYNQLTRLRRETTLLILAFLLLSLFAAGAAQQEEVSTVASHMKVINQSFRELRRQLDDPARAEANFALIEKIKQRLLAARKARPPKAETLPESERVPFIEAYQSLLDDVVTTLSELHEAIQAEKWSEAKALVNKLNGLKKEGHSKFQEE